MIKLFLDWDPYHIEISPLICSENHRDDLHHGRVKLKTLERNGIQPELFPSILFPSIWIIPCWTFSSQTSKQAHESDLVQVYSTCFLIRMGFLGVRFDVGRGKITPSPCLKLVRITLKTWNLVRKCTHICSFRKYTF